MERRHLSQVELSSAANTFLDYVIATVDEKNGPFLDAENTRPTTVEMTETPVSEDDGVLWRDRLRALRARRLWLIHIRPSQVGRWDGAGRGLGAALAQFLHGRAECGEGGFGLTDQYIGSIAQLLPPLHEGSCCFPRHLSPTSNFSRK